MSALLGSCVLSAGLALVVGAGPVAADASADYQAAVAADSPTGYWRFNDVVAATPAGCAADPQYCSQYSAATTGLSESGDARWYGPPFATEPHGIAESQAVHLSGGPESWVDVGTEGELGSYPAASTELYFRPTAWQSGSEVLLATKWGFTLALDHGALILSDRPDNGPASRIHVDTSGLGTVSLGDWHHLVVLWDAVHHTLGIVVDKRLWFALPTGAHWAPDPSSWDGWTGLGVGSWPGGNWGSHDLGFIGDVDELAVYPGLLSQQQIGSHMGAAGLTVPSDDPAITRYPSAAERYGSNPALRNELCVTCLRGDPVDTFTGNFHEDLPGLSLPSRAGGLGVGLAYNSLAVDSSAGKAGFGFSTSAMASLRTNDADGSKDVVQETGALVPFAKDGSGWKAPGRFSATLVHETDGTWTFTRNHTETLTFRSTGEISQIRDRFGDITRYRYPAGSSLPDQITDQPTDALAASTGHFLALTWTSGRLTKVTGPTINGTEVSMVLTYDSAGELTDYRDPSGGHWVFGYDGSHRVTSVRKPRQATKAVTLVYDAVGRVESQTNELGAETTFAYDQPAVDSTTTTVKGGGTAPDRVSVDRYVDGRRVESIEGYGTAAQSSTRFSYDPVTNALTSVVRSDGNSATSDDRVWTYGEDAVGNNTSETDPTGRVTRWAYNSSDQVTSVATGETAAPLSPSTTAVVTTSYSYNASNGRLDSVTAAVGTSDAATTAYTYGDSAHLGDVTTVTDARLKAWPEVHDPVTGLVVSSSDPLTHTATTTYNALGWPTVSTSPRGNATAAAHDFEITYEYDLAARTTTVTGPAGDVTVTVLDADGNTASVKTGTGTGDTTSYDYTDTDQLSVVHLPGGATKSYLYWPGGEQKRFTNENGDHWDYTYDPAGHLLTSADPKDRTETYGYDAYGNLTTVTQAAAGATCTAATKVGCVTYAYDAAGRPTGIDYSDTATPDVTGIGYDALGRRTAATRAATATSTAATESWGWNAASELTSHVDVNGQTTSYRWDPTGNLDRIRYPDQTVDVVRGFDDAGRLTTVKDWAGRVSGFDYDEDSNWTTSTFPMPSGTANTDVYGYDAAGRMTSATWRQGPSTGTVLGSETYTRPTSKKGMVDTTTTTGTATTSGANPTTNTYDGRDRLTAAGSESFAIDPAGNLTKGPSGQLQVVDPAQQLCWTSPIATTGTCASPPSDATTYSYDERGNRTSQQPVGGVGSKFTYDQANRLTSADVPSVQGGEGQLATFSAARLLDTRSSSTIGACDPSPCARLASGVSKTVTLAGQPPLPASNVAAVWATVTVISPSASGYLRVNANGTAASTTLNYAASTNANITAIIPLTDGKLTLVASTATDVVLDVTGYFKTAGSTADTYRSSTPSRLVDTRNGTGTCDGNPCSTRAAGQTTSVTAAGQAGLPASGLHAAVISLTVIAPASPGQVKVDNGWGGGGAATINYVAGRTVNETVVVPVDSGGRFTLWTGTVLDVVIDVSGYFTVPSVSSPGMAFHATSGASRLVTVASGGSSGPCVGGSCGALVGSVRQRIQVAGQDGVPSSAVGVVGSVTFTDPAVDGYVRLNPTFSTGMGLGADETVNVLNGQVRSSVVLLPLKSDGTIEIVATAAIATWSFDIAGYFTQPTGTFTYGYDTTGTRATKTDPDAVTTEFTYSAGAGLPLLLRQKTGSASTWIIYGPGDQPIEQIDNAGTATWLHHDQLGSVRLSTSSTDGTEASRRTFNAYGTTKAQSGTQPLLGYAGQYTDGETGFQYLRARYYDPTTGQFLSVDPLVSITAAPLAYADQNPVHSGDPSGLCTHGFDCSGDYLGGVESNGGMTYTGSPVLVTPNCDQGINVDGRNQDMDADGNLQQRRTGGQLGGNDGFRIDFDRIASELRDLASPSNVGSCIAGGATDAVSGGIVGSAIPGMGTFWGTILGGAIGCVSSAMNGGAPPGAPGP
ncbi:RHS repeat-associated core domain-containing protein [Aquihabitans sp. McL0605]|uniref:RHS repeat-associated core domain-containing protein n=1 Tax=Aquihabitans sp. McL0605 TaxID=3415671 RepID=UPI003CFB84F5